MMPHDEYSIHVEVRLYDLQAYEILVALAAELEELSERIWSLSSSSALKVEQILVRRLAFAVYRACLR
jgi:ribosomal protein S4